MSELNLDQVLTKRHDARKEIVDVNEQMIKLVIFALSEDWFAFLGDHIREILAHADLFFVPGCPAFLEGVINVRGDIESVIRLHDLLQLHIPTTDRGTVILLGRSSTMSSGIRVDRVVDVVDIPLSFIQTPPATIPDQMRPYVSGLLRFQERPVTLLDLDKIFSDYALGLG